jgi:ketosteroid isomerase-like protein
MPTAHAATLFRLIAVAVLAAVARPLPAQRAADPRLEIIAFNRALDSATRHMDNAATLALWDDDGVSLLPSTKPIIGKAAIADFLDRVTSGNPGARMQTFELECFDIQVSDAWASEWCTEHQVVSFVDGKHFDGRGKMLLVLHRGSDGRWRLHTEMWNQAASIAPPAVR